MEFEDAADELYGLLPDDFVAARNDLAKRTKADGDADLAARIQTLRKPTSAAWLANQVGREKRADLDRLLELGQELRDASAALDGDRLRELTPRRHDLVDKLVRSARDLAKATRQHVSADVAQKLHETLDAAMVDPAAAAAVSTGRLTSALRHVGFGVVDESGEPSNVVSLDAARTTRARTGKTSPDRQPSAAAKRARQQAERDHAEAESAVDATEATVEARAGELDEQKRGVAEAQATIDRLAAELDDAREQLEQARSDVRRRTDELDAAKRAARDARRRSREAKQRLGELEP